MGERAPLGVVWDDLRSPRAPWMAPWMVPAGPRVGNIPIEGQGGQGPWGDPSIPHVEDSPVAGARGKRDREGWVRGVE